MTRRSVLVLMCAAACGQPGEPIEKASTAPAVEAPAPAAPAAPVPPAPPKPDPIVKGVPHGGHIDKVATTENADAALTFDTAGGVRLWPALDGSRTPVPVSVVAPEQVGLAHAGRDLLATILDEAGSVRLMRLGRDGSVRGNVQLPADVPYQQVIALDEGALVRSEDQTIEWFSPDGISRGKLVAEPGRRIQAIAARRGRAVAVISGGDKHELRWLLMLASNLTWGASVTLPKPVKSDLIALSPSHRRLAIIDDKATVNVYELGLVPTQLGITMFGGDASEIGFIDEDRVAIMGRSVLWWVMPQKKPANDPWATAAPSMPTPASSHMMFGGAAADDVAVLGFGAALALIDKDKTRYLGYKEHGVGAVGAAKDSLWVMMSGSHIVWLDDKLAVKRDIELRKDQSGPWINATPVGDRHIITQTPSDTQYRIELVDLETPDKPVPIGTFSRVGRIELSQETGLLGISAGRKIHRFKVDLATNQLTKLEPIRTQPSITSLRLLDPETADGITAITVGWYHEFDEHYTLTVHRAKGKPTRIRPFKGRLIDIDARGNVYTIDGKELVVHHGDKKVSTLKLDEYFGSVVGIGADGTRIAMQTGHEIVMRDATGAEQWRKPLWGTNQLVFTNDGKYLAVRANGGLVMLDAATGERTAMECGWSFGLTSTPPPTNALASAPVCEDPML
ncbi:MAG TPA: hypothetical protein VIV11_37900 [Kofleriaceae bacterium]